MEQLYSKIDDPAFEKKKLKYLKEELDLNEALTHFSIIFTKG